MNTEKVVIAGNTKTFNLAFDISEGRIEMNGDLSSSKQLKEAYNRIHLWTEIYKEFPQRTTRLDIEVDNIDATGVKWLFETLSVLVDLDKKGHSSLSICWYMSENQQELVDLSDKISNNLKIDIHVMSPFLR